METEDLVVRDAVEELKAARAEEEPAPRRPYGERTAMTKIGDEEEARDDEDQLTCVEETIGHQTDLGCGATIKVMPRQDLMEDDFVESSHDADTDRRGRSH